MSAAMRRGACPSLAAPMLTGDGWLARLAVAEMTGAQLASLASAAARLGNGLVEVTGRGNLQLRGLSRPSAAELAAMLGDLGIAVVEGLPVVTGVLAGIDPVEVADPRPLAAALRERTAALGLLPKVSVVVDGGGMLHLDAVPADLRLIAVDAGRAAPRWRLVVANACEIGTFEAEAAVAAAASLFETLAARRIRARDLGLVGEPVRKRAPVEVVGRLAMARGLGLPFGQADAAMLDGLAAEAAAARFRPAAGRALVVVGAADDAALVDRARRLGFVVEPDDPRRRIVACSGAPACASARLPTRAVAREVIREGLLWGPGRLHLSGCAKRCAQPVGPAVTLVGTAGGWELTGEGMAVPPGLSAALELIIGRAGR